MTRRFLLLTSLVVAAACQQQQTDRASNTSTTSNVAAPAAAVPVQAVEAAPRAAGCADQLTFVMNPSPNQAVMQDRMPADRLEQVRSGTERRFKEVAAQMCGAGELAQTAFTAYDRVMVTDAEGATEPNIYPGEGRTLNYEFAFADDQTLPPAAEFRAAFLCMANPNQEGCFND